MWFLFDSIGNNIFLVKLWIFRAKEKKKRGRIARVAIISLAGPARKEKRQEKGSKPTHTKKHLSFLFLSN